MQMFTVEAKELVVASFGDCYFIFGGLELISHENSTRDVWSSSCNMEPERYHHPCIPVFFGGSPFFPVPFSKNVTGVFREQCGIYCPGSYL